MDNSEFNHYAIGAKVLQVSWVGECPALKDFFDRLSVFVIDAQKTVDACIEVYEQQRAPLPEFAVRTHNNDRRSAREFVCHLETFYIRPAYSVAIDYPGRNLRFFAHNTLAEVVDEFENSLRWVLCELAQQQGLIYFPGQGIKHGEFCSILTGHPECGRSDLVALLQKSGGYTLVQTLASRIKSGIPTPCLSFPAFCAPGAKQPELSQLKDLFASSESRATPASFFGEVGILRSVYLVNRVCALESRCERIAIDNGLSGLRQLYSRAFEYLSVQQISRRIEEIEMIASEIDWRQFYLGEDQDSAAECIGRALNSSSS